MITLRDNPTTVKLLITAFGPFPGMPNNPSARLVAAFAREHRNRLARLGIELVTAELPVVFATVGSALQETFDTVDPDAIIHVGVAGRRAKLSVETRALNRIGTLRSDAARLCATTPLVMHGGIAQLSARWPAARLVAAMNRSGAVTRLSIDAGDYVCNQTLYLTLARVRVPAGFLHIPKPRVERRRKCNKASPRPRLAQMVQALARAAVLMAVEARRRG
jgi:pyroglutamyl-peptidase